MGFFLNNNPTKFIVYFFAGVWWKISFYKVQPEAATFDYGDISAAARPYD